MRRRKDGQPWGRTGPKPEREPGGMYQLGLRVPSWMYAKLKGRQREIRDLLEREYGGGETARKGDDDEQG